MDALHYDVLIVGAGPSGLSAAIRLKQLDPAITVCVLEKGVDVGAHILSGCVLDPCALTELLPDWQERGAPLATPATEDHFWFLTQSRRFPLPVPPPMRNRGNFIISLSQFCRWLGQRAEDLGVEIYPGFAAVEALFDGQGAVCGVKTGDKGVSRDGSLTARYQPGMAIYAQQTLMGEGCRGSLTESLIHHFSLREKACPQTYGLGLKEVWQVKSPLHKAGTVTHTMGWPLDFQTWGGGFAYHLAGGQVAIGFVVGLDYKNPWLSPFEEFQRFKLHPAIRPLLDGGKRLGYGARALNEGGWQSIPRLTFPGGAIMGCSAGFLNVPKIKGTHLAMKSGMLAAEGVGQALQGRANDYESQLRQSWVARELSQARNIRPAFRWGVVPGMVNAVLESWLFRGRAPWTFRNQADHPQLQKSLDAPAIAYPKPDGAVTFDRLSSVYLCHAHHPEDQPNHLKLADPGLAISCNLELYDSPEQRYCPAGVYEIVAGQGGQPCLQINSANCIHCKACDIKDPLQNISWTPPEGGSGPQYGEM